jgi:hypothetical protein
MVQLPKRPFLTLLAGAALAALCLGAVSAAPMGAVLVVTAKLAGASEVPATTSSGSGMLEGTFNQDTKVLNYTVSYNGLSGPVKAGHLHGPAQAGANAGVVVPFVDGMESPIKGTAVLTKPQADDLLAGKWYVNLHTASHPGGEVRGQVEVK